MAEIYVVMWEDWDEYNTCTGGDMYMSLDKERAENFLKDLVDKKPHLSWRGSILGHWSPYEWEKYYIDIRPLDEEL